MDALTACHQSPAAGSPDYDLKDLLDEAELSRFSDAFGKETDQDTQQAMLQDLMASAAPADIAVITQRSAKGREVSEDGTATDGKTAEAFASWGTQVNDMGERYNRFSESVISPLRNTAETNLARIGG